MKQSVMKYQTMNKQTGFTLIELVIVIVILGILAATAAPKFINLTGDAKAASLKAAKGAIESAATLVNLKARIAGIDGEAITYAGSRPQYNSTGEINNTGFDIFFGYPYVTDNGIVNAAGLSADEWDFDRTRDHAVAISVKSDDVWDTTCEVVYNTAKRGFRPVITIDVTGC